MLYTIVFICIVSSVSHAQQQPDCMIQCMGDMQKRLPNGLSMDGVMQTRTVTVGNATAICPQMNDTAKMDNVCKEYRTTKSCVDKCPDSTMKQMTQLSFGFFQFACVDRNDDWKKYMPCLSEHCVQIRTPCVSKCGSFDDQAKKTGELMNPGRGGPPATVDAISKSFAETCTSLSCTMTCVEADVNKYCGHDAYKLLSDLTWTTMRFFGQSLSASGNNFAMPQECKSKIDALGGTQTATTKAAAAGTTAPAGPATTGTVAAVVPAAGGSNGSAEASPATGDGSEEATEAATTAVTESEEITTKVSPGNITEDGGSGSNEIGEHGPLPTTTTTVAPTTDANGVQKIDTVNANLTGLNERCEHMPQCGAHNINAPITFVLTCIAGIFIFNMM